VLRRHVHRSGAVGTRAAAQRYLPRRQYPVLCVRSLANRRPKTANHDDGAVTLSGARIAGYLDCTGAKIRNMSGPALDADRLQVNQSVLLSVDQ
jgi:hypothetical protein